MRRVALIGALCSLAGSAVAAQVGGSPSDPAGTIGGLQPPVYSYGAGGSGPPPLSNSQVMFVGDSRTAFGESIARSGSFNLSRLFANGYSGWYNNAIGWKLTDTPSGMYGIASTTSDNAKFRVVDQGSASANINPGTSTNPNTANSQTLIAADKAWNINSMGATGPAASPVSAAPLSDAAGSAIYLDDTNDYPAAPNHYTATNPKQTMVDDASVVSQLVGASKHVFYIDGTPRGFSTAVGEAHACASCATTTITNTSGWADWNGFSSGGVTNVSSAGVMSVFTVDVSGTCAGSVTGTYHASAGVYTWCGTAPTGNMYISYSFGLGNSALAANQVAYQLATANWANSSASNYTDPACPSSNCAIAGLLNANPSVTVVAAYAALDNGDGFHDALAGSMVDGLHPMPYGAAIVANALQTAFNTAYPALTKLNGSPIYNNWFACNTTASATYSSSTSSCGGTSAGVFPGVMTAGGCPGTVAGAMEIFINGAKAAKSDGAGNWLSDGAFTVNSGAYNCATGAWTITFSANTSTALPLVIAMDPLNFVNNGLMDMNQGAVALPAGFTAAAGTAGVPKSWAIAAPACITASLAGTGTPGAVPSLSITVANNKSTSPITVTDADGTWPAVRFTITGMLNGTGCTAAASTSLGLKNVTATLANQVTANASVRALFSTTIDGVGGLLQGLDGVQQTFVALSSSFTPSWGSGAGTSLVGADGGGAAGKSFTTLNLLPAVVGQITGRVQMTPLMPTQDATLTNTASDDVENFIFLEMFQPLNVTVTIWRNGFYVRSL